MRSPNAKASAGSWVTIIIVAGNRLRSKGNSRLNCNRKGASRWPSGSSSKPTAARRTAPASRYPLLLAAGQLTGPALQQMVDPQATRHLADGMLLACSVCP